MRYPIFPYGFGGQDLEVELRGPFLAPRLLVDGTPPAQGEQPGQMLLRRSNGQVAVAKWGRQWVDVPPLFIDGEGFRVVAPLRWYEWLWCGLPVLLFLSGGIAGGLLGLAALNLNAHLLRATTSVWGRYLLTAGVSLAALLIYLIVISLLALMFRW